MSKRQYPYDWRKRGDRSPIIIVRWCRQAFGERGVGWDFFSSRDKVVIEIWDDRLDVMWTMWKE